METPICTVDAFTQKPFAGNPAGVCVFEHGLPEDTIMQQVALEMNVSETAFSTPKSTNSNEFNLRWFTPQTEVNLCGHATLATAHILFTEFPLYSKHETLIFHTLSGTLIVSKVPNSDRLQMNFPQGCPTKVTLGDTIFDSLTELLPINSKDEIVDIFYCATTKKLLVEVATYKAIQNLAPKYEQLVKINFGETLNVRGIIVTTRGGNDPEIAQYDFCSRYFAPWVGINEDPVTGSAHTVLGVYWAKKLNKNPLFAFQASARGGEMGTNLIDNNRILLEGNAVTVLRGKITLP